MSMEHEATANLTPAACDLSQIETSAINFPTRDQKVLAWLDLTEGLKKWRIWLMLGLQDIKLRYRRSVLGPFWITISMAITVYSMGFLYGRLFRADLQYYYPFLVAGMLTWTFIASAITELTDTFIVADGLIKQVKLPYTLYLHRIITRNLLIFFHNTLVMLPIYLLFPAGAKINFYTLLLIPGLTLIYVNALLYGVVLSMIGLRYRDISQIIKSLVTVIFFITPIMWNPLILPQADRIFVWINPFYSFIELIRAPLIGQAPTLLNVGMVLGVTALGCLLASQLFIKYRARLIYWL